MTAAETCRLCGSPALFLGKKKGRLRPDDFEIFRCSGCGYSFVGNPWLDYPAIYSEAYYRGRGADPLVEYVFELEHPERTIRAYEWKGIVDVVRSYVPLSRETRWLDFGAGKGGLVRHLRSSLSCSAWGYEHGWIKEKAQGTGIGFLSDEELSRLAGSFDAVTAIEVFEHVVDPLAELTRIRSGQVDCSFSPPEMPHRIGRISSAGRTSFRKYTSASSNRELSNWRCVRPAFAPSSGRPRPASIRSSASKF